MKTKLQVDSFNRNKLKYLVVIMLISSGISIKAQQDTSYKNTVRFNITNPMIFGNKAVILGYERVLKNNKTFSVNVGRAYYPKLVGHVADSAAISLNSSYKDKGLNLSADYRIYLKKENRYAAPRGVYIGPYYSYNYFNRVNSWTLNTEDFQGDLETDLTMNIHTAGIELGYQFVFWNRISLDMILLGPGVSYYSIKAKLDTSLSPEDESKFFEELNNFLSDKIPGYDQVIDDVEFKTKGSVKTTSLGFRYMIMIGYRF
jgi:hypothetical protein